MDFRFSLAQSRYIQVLVTPDILKEQNNNFEQNWQSLFRTDFQLSQLTWRCYSCVTTDDLQNARNKSNIGTRVRLSRCDKIHMSGLWQYASMTSPSCDPLWCVLLHRVSRNRRQAWGDIIELGSNQQLKTVSVHWGKAQITSQILPTEYPCDCDRTNNQPRDWDVSHVHVCAQWHRMVMRRCSIHA